MKSRRFVAYAVLAALQAGVVLAVAAALVRPAWWLCGAGLLLAIGALGAGMALFAGERRMAHTQDVLRREIEAVAAVPVEDLLADAVRSRDGGKLHTRLPAVTDAGLAEVTGRIEQLCALGSRMAADHEDIQSGYTEVFVNMFRRTQSLLQRQLQVIERLEQGERSPADMRLFFQLDHLVTRMRRNNENILVLSGTELVRATKKPVSIVDVFRAAMSEVGKYQRIRVINAPSARVSNTAAGDLIRIIAELLDNATSFSAPDKEVTINAELGRHHGLSIGVFDNGIGMSDEDIRKANEQLKRLGAAEIARSRRVGLFVVGRLAGRHGFTVELFGGDDVAGVSALITVPSSALLEEDVLRATLPGDSRLAERRRKLAAAQSARNSDAVAVTTSVRRPETKHATVETSGPRRMSSWYSRSKAWRTKRENGLDAARPDAAERIGKAHADVPQELPTRVPRLVAPSAARVPVDPLPVPLAEAPADLPTRVARPITPLAGTASVDPSPVPLEDVPSGLPIRSPRSGAAGGLRGWATTDPPRATAEPPGAREAGPPDPVGGVRVASRWFEASRGGEGATGTGFPPRPVTPAAQEPEPYTLTEDGLPLRKRGAHLVAGEVDANAAEARSIDRNPAHVRRRLSSYQLGVQKAMEQENRMRGRQQSGGWTVLERKAEK